MNRDDLMEALTDPNHEVREGAFQDISIEMDDDLARAISDVAAGTASDDIRADAIVALGPLVEECGIDYDEALALPEEFGGPAVSVDTFRSIVERLRAIYADENQPKVVRRRAFEVLVRDPQPWQAEEVRKHLALPDADWRLTAIFGMGSMPGFEKEILEAVKKGEGVELAEAVRAAAKMEVKQAAPRIRELAASNKTERELRLESILALPNVDDDAFEILEELVRSKDAEIREAAEEAMADLSMYQDAEDEDLGGDGD